MQREGKGAVQTPPIVAVRSARHHFLSFCTEYAVQKNSVRGNEDGDL